MQICIACSRGSVFVDTANTHTVLLWTSLVILASYDILCRNIPLSIVKFSCAQLLCTFSCGSVFVDTANTHFVLWTSLVIFASYDILCRNIPRGCVVELTLTRWAFSLCPALPQLSPTGLAGTSASIDGALPQCRYNRATELAAPRASVVALANVPRPDRHGDMHTYIHTSTHTR